MPRTEKSEGYVSITLQKEVVDEIDDIISTYKELGYTGRADAVSESIRDWLIKIQKYSENKRM